MIHGPARAFELVRDAVRVLQLKPKTPGIGAVWNTLSKLNVECAQASVSRASCWPQLETPKGIQKSRSRWRFLGISMDKLNKT